VPLLLAFVLAIGQLPRGPFDAASAQAAGVLGSATIGTFTDNDDRNTMNGSRFTASENGSVTSMSVYVAAVDAAPYNQFQTAIYTDSGGKPGNLLAQSTTGSLIGNAWNTVPISLPITAGTRYWLVYNNNARSGSLNNLKYSIGTAGQSAYRAQTFGTRSPRADRRRPRRGRQQRDQRRQDDPDPQPRPPADHRADHRPERRRPEPERHLHLGRRPLRGDPRPLPPRRRRDGHGS
jgi:hypothetical protein